MNDLQRKEVEERFNCKVWHTATSKKDVLDFIYSEISLAEKETRISMLKGITDTLDHMVSNYYKTLSELESEVKNEKEKND